MQMGIERGFFCELNCECDFRKRICGDLKGVRTLVRVVEAVVGEVAALVRRVAVKKNEIVRSGGEHGNLGQPPRQAGPQIWAHRT